VYAWFNGQVLIQSQSVSDSSAVFSTSAMKTGNISVQIAFQQNEAAYYEIFARTNITVAHQSSFASGGAAVTLLGDFALEHRHMLSGVNCAFGFKLAQLERQAQSATVCTAPSHTAGYTALGVTAGELHQMDEVITESIEFEFVEDFVLTSVHPRFGIADTSTLVTITGANFVEDLVCSFAGHTAPAHYVSSTEIQCVAPALMRGLVASVFLIRESWIGQVIDPVGQLDFSYVGAAIEVYD
jgi:hypothetical protein